MLNLTELSNQGANVVITVSVEDLRMFLNEVADRLSVAEQQGKEHTEVYLTVAEVTERLGVDRSSLWRWDRNGYLKKVRVGGKVRYKLSDVQKLMEG